MTITIRDVALSASVSVATVSRVLNGKDRVSPQTRKRVLEAIGRLNFQPNLTARAMVTKKTNVIGFVVPQIVNEYWARYAEVIQRDLWEAGFSLVTFVSDFDAKRETAILNMFLDHQFEGIIYSTTVLDRESFRQLESVKRLQNQRVPMVVLDSRMLGFPCVHGDHRQGARLAVQHLLRAGHTRIAYIGGERLSDERESGYRHSMMEHEVPVCEDIIIRHESSTVNFSKFGYDAVQQLLEQRENFTAIFCANDLIAMGAIRALSDASLQVPQDIAIVGFDDIIMASLFRPAITTIRQPIDVMGKAVSEMIQELITGINQPSVKKILFEMDLVVRESCGTRKS